MQISLKNISKTYPGGERAVRKFSLDLCGEELLVVAGAQMSGKTTLLRMIAGLEEITSGELLLDGKFANELSTKDRNIAMYFQNGGISPNATVYENLAYALKLRKLPPEVIKERVEAMAEILELSDSLSKKPKILSVPMRLRLALGRAFMREAPLLMDEPFKGLDPALRAKMNADLVKLQARMRIPVLYTTEDRAEAMSLGMRVAVMKDGFLLQADTPRNLYDYPETLFVAVFLGADISRGGVLKGAGGRVLLCFEGIEAELPEKLLSRIKERERYLDTGRELTVAFHAEDAGSAEALNLGRVLLFDGETERSILLRDENYAARSENLQADLLPPTAAEMAERKEPAPAKRRR